MKSYHALESRFLRISHLDHATSMLDWDEATMMPTGGAEHRGEAASTIELMKHEILVSPETKSLLEESESQTTSLNDWQKSNLRLIRKNFDRASLLPSNLVQEMTKTNAASQMAWREHRKNNDWTSMRPHFEKVFGLKKEAAQIFSSKSGHTPYESLMDMYEADLSEAKVNSIFDELRLFLPNTLQQVLDLQSKIKVQEPKGPYPIEKQTQLARFFAEQLGFKFSNGRLDVSHHPFCGGTPRDVRITTRYFETDFMQSLFGVLHETGHAKYEQNLPDEWLHQPVGRALGMMVHESQSLLTEMQICRGKSFLKFLLPKIKEAFGASSPADVWEIQNFVRLSSWIQPGLIRVHADEITYPLHIILRYEIERDIINGKLHVKDIPEIWADRMKTYLNIETKGNDRDGCLQDIHWPAGLIGYFPCYTLGALMAAQLYRKLSNDVQSIESKLEKGDFTEINSWLMKNIYSQASKLTADDLIQQITGEPLSAEPFKKHILKRYVSER